MELESFCALEWRSQLLLEPVGGGIRGIAEE